MAELSRAKSIVRAVQRTTRVQQGFPAKMRRKTRQRKEAARQMRLLRGHPGSKSAISMLVKANY